VCLRADSKVKARVEAKVKARIKAANRRNHSIREGIDRVVFLGSAPNGPDRPDPGCPTSRLEIWESTDTDSPADQLKSASLFIVARDDASGSGVRLPGIRAQYDKAPQPKRLIVLDGSAHAQYLFQTEQGVGHNHSPHSLQLCPRLIQSYAPHRNTEECTRYHPRRRRAADRHPPEISGAFGSAAGTGLARNFRIGHDTGAITMRV
jgi:hypothetical protein